tara:strand:- start:9906 stop:10112 length:207 start_codon:yes stop_codon:yes gene_type:complete
MKENIIENLIRQANNLKIDIQCGKQPNKNNMDGWTMQGLEKKFEQIKAQLEELGYILENDDAEKGRYN